MTTAREVVLKRIRDALGVSATDMEVPREYGRRSPKGLGETLALLEDRLLDYGATVIRCDGSGISEAVALRLIARGFRRSLVPFDLPAAWMADASVRGVTFVPDSPPGLLSKGEMAGAEAVVTGCSLAIAETGTLLLDGGFAQGRRALSLLPDYHLCVVRQNQVVESVPQAVSRMAELVKGVRPPFTLISGPSATSDIELIRVEGVHGPRTLDVILVEE